MNNRATGSAHEAGDSLQRFQDVFAAALIAPTESAAVPALVAALLRQPGFAVYRNTFMKGCIDALQLNYPTVARLVGEQWFRAAAMLYVRACSPECPMLLQYGAGFARFLDGFAPARELPYLSDVARVDRFWTEAHAAHDETPVPAQCIAALSPQDLARTVLRPHASARWAWFDAQPIATIWRRNRGQTESAETSIAWQGEGILVVRPRHVVVDIVLDAAACAFLDACAAGLPLAAAAHASTCADAHADLKQLIARLLGAGAFGAFTY